MHDVVGLVSQRLQQVGRFQAAAELHEGIDDVQGAGGWLGGVGWGCCAPNDRNASLQQFCLRCFACTCVVHYRAYSRMVACHFLLAVVLSPCAVRL